MKYRVFTEKKQNYRVSRHIHSVFFEYFGKVIGWARIVLCYWRYGAGISLR